jgi:hypothetical protein
MATTSADNYAGSPTDSWGESAGRRDLAERAYGFVSHPAEFAVAGLAIGALLVAASMYFAPDVKRYLKMRSM